MSVYRRGNVWWIKYHVNGKPIRESSKSPDRKEAVQLDKQRRAEAFIRGAPPAKRNRMFLDGIVYVIEIFGYYKIGMTGRRIEERFYGAFPIDPMVIKLWTCRDICYVEKKIHAIFQHRRIRGEWFRLLPEDLEWIKAATIFDIMRFTKSACTTLGTKQE